MRVKLQFYFLGNMFFSLLCWVVDDKIDTTHTSVCSIWSYSHETINLAKHKDLKQGKLLACSLMFKCWTVRQGDVHTDVKLVPTFLPISHRKSKCLP